MTCFTVRSKPISSFVVYTNKTKIQMKLLSLCQDCKIMSIYVDYNISESNQMLLT